MGYGKKEVIVLPLALAIIIISSYLLSLLLKNKSNIMKRILVATIPSILIILEIAKQTIAFIEGYTACSVPLHFCSLFMLWFSLAEYGQGKIRQMGQAISMSTSILFFIMFYINPTSIIGSSCNNVFSNFSSFHTFTYHHLIIFYLFLNVFLKMYQPKKKDLVSDIIFLTIYFIVGVSFANILNCNYCNFLYSNIDFMKELLDRTNYVFYLFVMYTFGISATCFINYLYFIVYNLKKVK